MLKLLLATAPYLLKATSQSSKKQKVRSLTALVLFCFAGGALVAAAFVFVTSLYGAAVGFLTVSALFTLMGLVFYFKVKNPKSDKIKDVTSPAETTTDPIAALIPEAALKDPAVAKLLNQVVSNPVATSLAAAAISMMITREIMKD